MKVKELKEILSKHDDNNEDEVKTILQWYARYELGKEIYDCIEENGQCHFEAEL